MQFPFGVYPTPVERLSRVEMRVSREGSAAGALWIKRDDLTHPDYGGNKVRKLEHILPAALRCGARRILTVGAVGSHHVLATTLFGRRAGFDVEAVLVPQPRTAHVEKNLRADLALGLSARGVPAMALAPFMLAGALGEGTYFVPMGGSNVLGARGYVDAAHELAEQVRAGALPKPDVVVVTVGSGGTAAGVAVGLAQAKLDVRVVGVCVATPVFAVRVLMRFLIDELARAVARKGELSREIALSAHASFSLVTDFLGAGYGAATEAGDRATEIAAEENIVLDPTYTAKTFAAALRELERGGNVLYWHTLSSAPLAPLLHDAPSLEEVPAGLRSLMR